MQPSQLEILEHRITGAERAGQSAEVAELRGALLVMLLKEVLKELALIRQNKAR